MGRGSCLRGKNRPAVSNGRRVRIKECNKDSRNDPAPTKASNKVISPKNKVVEACARLFNKVTPNDNIPEDKSKTADSSPGGDDQKRDLKINMGGNVINANGEGCVSWLRV